MKTLIYIFFLIFVANNTSFAQKEKTKQKLIIYKSDIKDWDEHYFNKIYEDSLILYSFEIDTNIDIRKKRFCQLINLDTVKNLEQYHLKTLVTKNRYVFFENGLYGIKNRKGEIVYPAIYDKFYKSTQNFYYARNNKNHLWGLFDKNLNQISDCNYNDIYCRDFKKGCFVKSGKYWGSIDAGGNVMIPIVYIDVTFTSDGLFLGLNDRWHDLLTIKNDTLFTGKNGHKITKHFENNNKTKFIYKEKDKYGLINNKGEIELDPIYDNIFLTNVYFNKSYQTAYLYKQNDGWSLKLGDTLIFSSLDFVEEIKNEYSPLTINFYKKNGKLGIVNNFRWRGVVITPPIYDDIRKIVPVINYNFKDFNNFTNRYHYRFSDDWVTLHYLYAKKDSLWAIITEDGTNITDFLYQELYYFNKKAFIAKKNNKWGILDTYGKPKSKFDIDNISKKIIDNKYILLIKNKSYGLIDDNANIILEPQYQQITKLDRRSNNTLIKVKKNNKWGLIDLDRRYLLKTNSDIEKAKKSLLDSHGGEQSAIINVKGEMLLNPDYDEMEVIKIGLKLFLKVKKDELWKLYDIANRQFVGEEYISILFIPNDNSIYAQNLNGKYGTIVNIKANKLDFIYDDISPVSKKFIKKIKLNGKYGLINKENDFVLNCEYNDIKPFDDSKIYKLNVDEGWKIFNEENKSKIESNSTYTDIIKLGNNFFKVRINDKYGIINQKDSLIVNYKFDEIKFIPNKFAHFDVFAIKKDNKWGIIKITKKSDLLKQNENRYNEDSIIDPKLDSIYINKDSKQNYINVSINGKSALLDIYNDFQPVFSGKYDDLKELRNYKNKLHIYKIKINNKWKLIKIKEDRIKNKSTYNNNYHKIYKTSILTKNAYDEIENSFDKNTFITKNNKLYGIINIANNIKIQPKYEKITKMNNFLMGYLKNNKCEEISIKGKISPVDNNHIFKKKRLNLGLFKQRKGCYYGIIDKKGKVILDYKYTDILSFKKKNRNFPYDMAKIKYFDKEGYVLTDGTILVEPVYDVLRAFQEDMARVKLNEKWGFIDTSGKLVIDAKYDYVEPFTNGKSKVTLNGNTFYIDKKGNIIK